MAFVNEYVSDEDVKKYDLEGLYKKWWKRTPPYFGYNWTVDRERDCYYMQLRTTNTRDGEVNVVEGVLYYREILWTVAVKKSPESSSFTAERPYRIVWEFRFIRHPEGGIVPEDEIIPVLKEALTVFQVSGVNTPDFVPTTDIVTTFTF